FVLNQSAGRIDFVSVSTSGSKGVQLRYETDFVAGIECFSIHKRIEGGATPFFARFFTAFSLSARIRAVLRPFFCF
ncbi:hypothetical protein, partial [Bellilinea sp.]